MDEGIYKKSVLDNGIRVVTEELSHGRSVSIGIWVSTGSRDEQAEENGISHFIEHLLFKGTKRRSALQIAKEIDSVGGVLNAFTGREYTGIYAKVLDKDLPLAVDVLSDIFLNSLFNPKDVEKERKVILQEISLVEDTPDDYIHDLFNSAFFGNHPLGRAVLGTGETVSSFSRDQIYQYFKGHYIPSRMVISAAGRLSHDRLVELIKGGLGEFFAEDRGRNIDPPQPSSTVIIKSKDLEQVHFCLGTASLPHCHPRRYSSYVLNSVFGGSMSSRLFQEIREERGLAYSVYSYLNAYMDAGSLTVYVGTSQEALEKAIKLTVREAEKLTTRPIDDEELSNTREQLKGNLLLSMEHTENWMSRLAKNEIYYGRSFSLKETIERIDEVTAEEVKELAQEIFNPQYFTLAILGPISDGDISQDILRQP